MFGHKNYNSFTKILEVTIVKGNVIIVQVGLFVPKISMSYIGSYMNLQESDLIFKYDSIKN